MSDPASWDDPSCGGPAQSIDWRRSWESAPCGLVDADLDGLIVAVNGRACELSGFTVPELVGRKNWLDLLSVGNRIFYDTQLAPVLLLEGSISEIMVDVVTRGGDRLPALLTVDLLLDETGATRGTRIALMAARDRRQFEISLRNARDAAERADRARATALRRLELQADATEALASSTDLDTAVDRLAQVLVPRLAGWCVIFTVDPSDPSARMRWTAAHADPDRQAAVERVAELLSHGQSASNLFLEGPTSSPTTLMTGLSEQLDNDTTADVELRDLYQAVGVDSTVVAPSYARGERVAVTIVVRGDGQPEFVEDDRADMAEVAGRTGIFVDSARRFAREHADSMTLQQSLLTAPPSIPALEIAVRYIPAQDGAQVGGDWYDAFVQPDGATVVAIGDVMGHDIAAAAAMGQIRGIIRTIGHTIAGQPSDTLTRADLAARGLQTAVIASAILARIEDSVPRGEPGHDGVTLRWSNAGHPPPMLVTATGEATVLTRPTDVLLGVDPHRPRHDHEVRLAAGDTVVLYTDGLIERSHQDIDEGLRRLADALAGQHAATLGSLCDSVLDQLGSGSRDDIAMLALRVR